MQLILNTEPAVDISNMTELKDTISEKLSNNIVENLKCSSDKENIEEPENIICNGNCISDKVASDGEPIAKHIREETGEDIARTKEIKTVKNIIENTIDEYIKSNKSTDNCHESQNNIKQNIISSTQLTEGQVFTESKQEIEVVTQERNGEVNVSTLNENNDNEIATEVIDNVQDVSSEKQIRANDDQGTISKIENLVEKSVADIIEITNEDLKCPKDSEDANATNKIIFYEATKSNDAPKDLEMKNVQANKPSKLDYVDTVVSDEKCSDHSVKEVEYMEVDITQESVKKTTANSVDSDKETNNTKSNSDTMEKNEDELIVVEDLKEIAPESTTSSQNLKSNKIEQPVPAKRNSICRLSNTLDILSDDDEEDNSKEDPKTVSTEEAHEKKVSTDKQCISVDEDDDIMVIEEDIPPIHKENKTENIKETTPSPIKPVNSGISKIDEETGENKSSFMESIELVSNKSNVESAPPDAPVREIEKVQESDIKNSEIEKNLVPDNLLSLSKKKLSEMTREDLEEFCVLKIVESIMDRSQLSDIKAKLSTVMQSLDDFRRKATLLTKQNRDLQVILKSVQEEQKKVNETYNVITPLKITRSVGMQVFLSDKCAKKKNGNILNNKPKGIPQTPPRPQKPVNQNIPVPRLVPASNTGIRSPPVASNATNASKPSTPIGNGVKNTPVPKVAEKRPFSKVQAVTVDLTDDEPPPKITQRASPAPSVRIVSPQNLMAAPRAPNVLNQMMNNNPRKVFIPIGAQTNNNIRSGHNVMLKTVTAGPKPRSPNPNAVRPQNQGRVRPGTFNRHPAPLPDVTKQYQSPNWKSLPPAPDLKLSKVENGIVISWKIDGYQEDLHEQIASYQLYAYQETTSPPSTALWKKIGDVKALPLPMACTLTQFTAGFKYFFAVRAVDVRLRVGPFSLPGSILLLQKM